jgi:hypothetical protein
LPCKAEGGILDDGVSESKYEYPLGTLAEDGRSIGFAANWWRAGLKAGKTEQIMGISLIYSDHRFVRRKVVRPAAHGPANVYTGCPRVAKENLSGGRFGRLRHGDRLRHFPFWRSDWIAF